MPGPGQHGGFHRHPTPPPAPTFADKISEASHQLIGATAFPVAAGSVTPTQAAVVASLTALLAAKPVLLGPLDALAAQITADYAAMTPVAGVGA